MDWKPIETAPKDGTPILAYSERNGSLDLLRWSKNRDGYEECLTSLLGYGSIPIAFVTHWHPLPELPKHD